MICKIRLFKGHSDQNIYYMPYRYLWFLLWNIYENVQLLTYFTLQFIFFNKMWQVTILFKNNVLLFFKISYKSLTHLFFIMHNITITYTFHVDKMCKFSPQFYKILLFSGILGLFAVFTVWWSWYWRWLYCERKLYK